MTNSAAVRRPETDRFTSVVFHNFKTFKNFSIGLTNFNILVGPNNSGKSTIISAFRILAEAMRKARTRSPELVKGPNGQTFGYHVSLSGLQIATENIFSDYDDSHPATIRFRTSSGRHLTLYFPEPERCVLLAEASKPIRTPTVFKSQFNCDVAFVPVLGPVEHNEPLYKPEAARQALITNGASRNFRNIWYHYPEPFLQFQDMLRRTWPGMDIERPGLAKSTERPLLHMFCIESRIPRELFWAGFGFQVWCQMLTYIIEGRGASLLAIDEPDIYLHSDLQRQLLGILKDLGPDILIATHSTELVADAEPNDIVVVTKGARSAKRLRDPSQLQAVFSTLGSNLNPTLTQLAKTKRALFVEGKDFYIISLFAERLGILRVATRAQFAVIPAEGFNPTRVAAVGDGIDATLGSKVLRAAIFDRDFRSDGEVELICEQLRSTCRIAWIHSRKEIENFLLVAPALNRATIARLTEKYRRGGERKELAHDLGQVLDGIAEALRVEAQSQFMASFVRFHREVTRVHAADLTKDALQAWEARWSVPANRLLMLPGKAILSRLNSFLMESYGVSLSPGSIVRSFTRDEVAIEMTELVNEIDRFCSLTPGP